MPTVPGRVSAAPIVLQGTSVTAADRSAMRRTIRARFAKPVVQSFAHPPNWQVERVTFLDPIGTMSIATPPVLNPQRTLLTVHWQDIHNIDPQGDERGLWFFAGYTLSITMIGPKGTWP